MENFYKKNELGVLIEYTLVGRYEEDDNNYIIYTDFVEDINSPTGLRLFVSLEKDGELINIDHNKENEILNKMFQSLMEKTEI